jgi:hypothetical protein
MALKGDRHLVLTDVSFFMNEVATRGGVVCMSTVGSGAALDQSQALVTYKANASGNRPIGLLLEDMVNYDLTRQHANFYRDEVQIGGKVALLRKGWVTTSSIIGTPAVNDAAVLDNSGNLSPVAYTSLPTANTQNKPVVGYFMSAKDEDGYAKVNIDL